MRPVRRQRRLETAGAALSPAFLRLYLLTLLFFSANPLIQIVLPLYSESEGWDNRSIGIMMGAYLLVSMLFRPWAGVVVARFGTARTLRTLMLANAGVLSLYLLLPVSVYIVIRGLQGTVTAFFSLAMQMSVVEALPEKERAQGLSLYLLVGMLPSAIVPAIALQVWESGGMSGFGLGLIAIALATAVTGYRATLPEARQEVPEVGEGPENGNAPKDGVIGQLIDTGRRHPSAARREAPEDGDMEQSIGVGRRHPSAARQEALEDREGAKDGESPKGRVMEQPIDAGRRHPPQKRWLAGGLMRLGPLAANRYFVMSSLVMLTASVGFGAVTTFLALYVKQIETGHAGVFFAVQAGVMVLVRFGLRSRVPSDGRWHPGLLAALLGALGLGILLMAMAPRYEETSYVIYIGAALTGFGMALIYPALAAYLSIKLAGTARNVLIGLFISVSDLGVLLGNTAMGWVADASSYASMYALCAALCLGAALLVWGSGNWMRRGGM